VTAEHRRRHPGSKGTRSKTLTGLVAGLSLWLPLAAGGLALTAPAAAQDDGAMVMRIAAVVNDDVISVYDIEARMRILIASAGIPDNPQVRAQISDQVLRSLIDETLKLQAAEREGLEVTDDNMRRAIAQVEQQNGIPPGGFEDFIQVAGLDRDSALRQIRAGVAWVKTVQVRFRGQVDVTEDQVDVVLERLAAARGKPEHLVREIFLPVDNPADDAQVRHNAEQLIAELKRGASFAALARQFSRSPTAARGGDMGWVRAGELNDELEQALMAMAPKSLSDPIRTINGYYVLYLADRRLTAEPEPDKARLTISQIALPNKGPVVPSAAVRAEIKEKLAAGVDSCEAFDAIAEPYNLPRSGSVGTVILNTVPEPLHSVLVGMDVGEISDPVDLPAGEVILMLCDRDVPGGMPSREAVRDRLLQQRLDVVSNRYLRTLRQQALIDVRI